MYATLVYHFLINYITFSYHPLYLLLHTPKIEFKKVYKLTVSIAYLMGDGNLNLNFN